MPSDNIVPFQRPEEPQDPHLSGEARCVRCERVWAAVAPVGTERLECPHCGTMHGLFVNTVACPVGGAEYVCKCGCTALTAYKNHGLFYFRCITCGADHTNGLFGEA